MSICSAPRGFSIAEQGKGAQSPPPSPAPHPLAHTTYKRRNTPKPSLSQSANSGSLRIGIKLPFQAHFALESNIDLRLIYGLEYATLAARLVNAGTGN